eukprot:231769_1
MIKKKQTNGKQFKDLKFEPVLNVKEEVKDNNVDDIVGKCSVDSSLGLLAIESKGKISCIDIKEKKKRFLVKNVKHHSVKCIVIIGLLLMDKNILQFNGVKIRFDFLRLNKMIIVL